jgi:hypothetical protein
VSAAKGAFLLEQAGGGSSGSSSNISGYKLNEYRHVTVASIVTTALWAIVLGLIVGMWVMLAVGHPHAASAFGFTGCATSAVAATASIRRYACRTFRLIRTLHGLEGDAPVRRVELHTVESPL